MRNHGVHALNHSRFLATRMAFVSPICWQETWSCILLFPSWRASSSNFSAHIWRRAWPRLIFLSLSFSEHIQETLHIPWLLSLQDNFVCVLFGLGLFLFFSPLPCSNGAQTGNEASGFFLVWMVCCWMRHSFCSSKAYYPIYMKNYCICMYLDRCSTVAFFSQSLAGFELEDVLVPNVVTVSLLCASKQSSNDDTTPS